VSSAAPLRSAILMVEFLSFPQIAGNIDRALRRVLREERAVTKDPGGQSTTDEMCNAIIGYLE
jgi:isocitrate/isopropylmalate dehydrogenase